MLQKSGGLFQLLADVDFGTAFGVKSLYYKTRTSNISDAGQFRLARADVINWRNQANDGNLSLGVSATDTLQFNGADIQTSALTQNHIYVGSAGGVATDVAMSGDATIVASGALTIAANAVSNAKLAQIATARFKGRVTAGTGDVEDLTGTQATTLLDNFVGDSGSGGTKGLVPAPAAGDAAANKFLKASGAWANLTGDVAGPGSSTDNALARFDSTTGKIIQNSLAILTDGGNLSGIVDFAMTGALTGCTSLTVDNLNIDGNTIITTGSNLPIVLTPNGTGQVISNKRALFNAPVQFGETVDTSTTGPDVSLPATSNIKYQNVALTEIRSIGAGTSGNYLILTNETGGDTAIRNQDAGATAANRIITGTGADLSMSSNTSIALYYDTESTRWRVIGGSGGGSGGSPIVARASSNSGQSIAALTETVINFEDITYDPDSVITTGASWKMTVPAGGAGKYRVSAHILCDQANYTINNVLAMNLRKNGAAYSRLGEQLFQTTAASAFSACGGSDTIELADGDYIDVTVVCSQAMVIDADNALNHVAIERVVQSIQAVPIAPNSAVYVTGDNGHGSAGTAIRCFDSEVSRVGSDITYTQDTTNGDYFTINSTGLYALMWWDRASGGITPFGFTKNQSVLTDNALSIPFPTELIHVVSFVTQGDGISATAYLQAGDVIRCNDAGGSNNSSVPYLSIVRVS